jgi:hypothetical protein
MAQGSSCEKPADPKVKKELDTKLAQMQAERLKQDQMWAQQPITNKTENTFVLSNYK